MEKGKSHFVLVHGACHGAWCWYKVITLLKSSGHKVTALDMAACGINPKQVNEVHSVSDYSEPLIEFMASLPSNSKEKVILVGHSLGGLPISIAMERFPEKVSAVVFASATMPGPDLTNSSLSQEYRKRTASRSWMDTQFTFDNGADKPPTSILIGPNFMASNLYQLSPPEDLTLAMILVRPLSTSSNAVPNEETAFTREKYGSVRRVFIVLKEDESTEEDLQRWMIEKNPPDEVMVIPVSDHMVMFSKPKELCSCLEEIAEKYD